MHVYSRAVCVAALFSFAHLANHAVGDEVAPSQIATPRAVEFDIPYANASEDQKLDIYLPDKPEFSTIVFTFGGGWHSGSRKSVQPIGEKLQSLGFCAVLPSHRLSPKDPFPAQAEDLAAAFAWVESKIKSRGGDPRRVFLMGHSSGAHLSLLVATDAKYLQPYQLAPSNICGVIGLSTPLDLVPRTDHKGYGDVLLAGRGADAFGRNVSLMTDASPLQHVGRSLPAALLVVGENDFPMLANDSEAFTGQAKNFGREVSTYTAKGCDHMGVVRNLIEDQGVVMEQVVAFVKKVAASSP